MPQNFQNYIAGAWHDGETTIENINPSDLSDSIGHYAQANRRQLDNTLDAAASAQKQWAETGLEARQSILMNIGNELMARREELGRLLSREEGKPLAEGMGEIYRAGQFFTYYAAETLRQIGDTADVDRPRIARAVESYRRIRTPPARERHQRTAKWQQERRDGACGCCVGRPFQEVLASRLREDVIEHAGHDFLEHAGISVQ